MGLITYLTRIHFADGIVEEALKSECARLSINRPLVVTDTGVAAAGLLDRILDALPLNARATIFDETPQNPTERACKAGLRLYREAECDGLVAVGGGSSMDLAKAVALMSSHSGELASYMAVEGGTACIQDIMPPVIAIPTTAGTGSEVGRGSLIVLDDNRKLGIISPFLIPKAAICDPTLTLGLPPLLTAATGMDALTHCVETYIATAYNPPADGIAIEGLKRGASNIRTATCEGHNLDARREMMAAALNGALAFQKGLGAVHAMSHALGGLPGHMLHHGMLNAILLPHVLQFNEPAVGDRYGALKMAMGLTKSADISTEIARLTQALGLPTTLGELGLKPEELDLAAELSQKDHTSSTNPRKATASDYLNLLQQAM